MDETKKARIIFLLVIIAAMGLGAGFLYLYQKKWESPGLYSSEQNTTSENAEDIIKLVGVLMILPEGENPTVATVTDPKQLKDQPFFAKAKIGDKVLIYTNAKKAILYRPEINKIIEVSALNIR